MYVNRLQKRQLKRDGKILLVCACNEKKKKKKGLASSCSLYRVDYCWCWLGIHPGSFRHGIIRSTGHFRNLSPMRWSGCRGCGRRKLHRCGLVLYAVLVHGICGRGGRRSSHVLALYWWHIRVNRWYAVELVGRLPITHRCSRRLTRRAVLFD